MGREFDSVIENIRTKDPRYKEDAYTFVMEALNFTQKKYRHATHVTGEQMLDGMRELLIEKFGPLTMMVLKHWGIESTEDFGNIVFNLVDFNVLSKTEEDRIEKFRDAYDFKDVFLKGYRKDLHHRISQMRG